MNLGTKSEYHEGMGQPVTAGKNPVTVYPSVTLRGKAAEAFCKACAAGDTLNGKVKVRVVETVDAVDRRQEYGGPGGARVELEIEDLDFPGVNGGENEDAESAEDAVDNYVSKKRDGGDDEIE